MASKPTLEEALQALDLQYNSSYQTPEAIEALAKTIKTFNITINDWNTLITHAKTVGISIKTICEILPEMAAKIKEMSTEGMSHFYTKTETDTKLSTKEDKSNKVTSLNTQPTDEQYPSAKAVFDSIANIRAVAEGKTATYIISYRTDIRAIQSAAVFMPSLVIYECIDAASSTFKDITEDVKEGLYNDVVVKNGIFNSQSNSINLTEQTNSYLIFSGKNSFLLVPVDYIMNYNFIKIGSVIIVVETDVPDRWSDGGKSFYKMETLDKSYLDQQLSTKLDKVTSEDDDKRVYSIEANGTQSVTAVASYEYIQNLLEN